jgi:hypothetical protein
MPPEGGESGLFSDSHRVLNHRGPGTVPEVPGPRPMLVVVPGPP